MSTVLLTAVGYGHPVGLRMPATEVAAVRRWLPYWWVDTDVEPERTWELTAAHEREWVLDDLELWVAEWAVGRVFVHAGVVAIDGRALLLPGKSTCGKSTLTAALLQAGAAYGSDEWAVLSPDGLVHPYPRPLQIRNGADLRRVSAAELGAAPFQGPLPVAAVAELSYRPSADYRAEPISAARAVLSLFDNTLCARTRAPEALDTLMAATDGIRAVTGSRGEAASAVSAMRALVSA